MREQNRPSEALAQELRRARTALDLSLRAVEDATGISNAYLSQLERGQVKTPSPQKLEKLATVYGMAYERLLVLAGYLKESGESAGEKDVDNGAEKGKLPLLHRALVDADLTPEDELLAVDYITFLSRRRKS